MIALPVGICEAWLWHKYVLQPNPFPLPFYSLISPADSIEFIITILKLMLGVFAVSSILYSLYLSSKGKLEVTASLHAGIRNWLRITSIVIPVYLVAWTPHLMHNLLGNMSSLSIIWGIGITFYYLIKYPLALPILVLEDETPMVCMRKGAKLSQGIRIEITLLILGFILLAETVCLALGYLLLPQLTEPNDAMELAFISTVTYFLRWFLYSPVLAVVYTYYRQQLATYVRSYLMA